MSLFLLPLEPTEQELDTARLFVAALAKGGIQTAVQLNTGSLLKAGKPADGPRGGKCDGSEASVKQASSPLRPHQHERGVRRSMVAMAMLPSRCVYVCVRVA